MRNIRNKNLFRWTLRGKPYFLLAAGSLLILLAIIGVML
jgi:hypothetical protein